MGGGETTEIGIETIEAWLIQAGLRGESDHRLVSSFCERAVSDGLPVSRALAIIDSLHPVYEGRVFVGATMSRSPPSKSTAAPNGQRVSWALIPPRVAHRPRQSRDGVQVLSFICCRAVKDCCGAASRRKRSPSFRSSRNSGPQA